MYLRLAMACARSGDSESRCKTAACSPRSEPRLVWPVVRTLQFGWSTGSSEEEPTTRRAAARGRAAFLTRPVWPPGRRATRAPRRRSVGLARGLAGLAAAAGPVRELAECDHREDEQPDD